MWNKKGFAVELMMLCIVGIVCLIFFAGWKYGINQVNTALVGLEATDSYSNVSGATSETFSYMNSGLDGLRIISFLIIFGFAIATLIMAYFIGEHPIFLFVYVILIGILIIFSVFISNAYGDLLSEDIIGTELQGFGISTFLMSKLPLWIGAIGFIGIVLAIASIYMRRETYG